MTLKVYYPNEYSDLESVMIHVPNREELSFLKSIQNPSDYRISEIPNIEKYIQEIYDYIELLESLNIQVYTDENIDYNSVWSSLDFNFNQLPNFIFLRDLALIVNNRIILANPKYEKARLNEEVQKLLVFLHEYKITNKYNVITKDPILADYNMEGADFLVKDNEVWCSVGNRTDSEFINSFPYINGEIGDQTKYLQLVESHSEGIPQHLLGCKHIVDQDLLISRSEVNSAKLGFTDDQIIHLSENEETINGYSMNIVVIGPREIIMPSGNPKTKQIYESNGIKVYETSTYEISKLSGSLACMTLPLTRINL